MASGSAPLLLLLLLLQLVLLLQLLVGVGASPADGLTIGLDGGYSNVVVKIGKEVPQSDCPKILNNLKVNKYSYML